MEYQLSELFDLQMGKTPDRNNPSYWNNNKNKWISIADLSKSGKYIIDTKETISNSAVISSGIKPIPPNTVVMSFKLSIGKTAITKEQIYSNEAIMAFIDKKIVQINPSYLYYLLANKKWDQGSNKAVMGITLNKASLSQYKVNIPNIHIQNNVVTKLDKLTQLIETQKKQMIVLDNLIKSRFVEMFGDPEINPKNWEQVTVKDVCSSIVRGPFGSMLKKEFFVEKGKNTYKVYEQKNAIQKNAFIGTYYVDSKKFTELKRFECISGDILMSCSGTMGKLYQLPTNCEKGLINQALCKFTLNSKILPVVFLTYMNETIGKLETKGSGIKNIAAVSYVKAMPINIPPIELQYQFANFVEQVNKSKFVVQKSIEELQTLYDSLMQKYFG